MNNKIIFLPLLLLFFLPAKSFCASFLPPIANQNFLSFSIEKKVQTVCTSENMKCKVSHYFQAHINLNFNSKSNSHLSKGLQNILKEVVETIYPPLLLIHQHDFVLHVTKYHPSRLLSRIPLRVDVNFNIA